MLMAVQASAQDMAYAKQLSSTNYYGTARSMALGNAVTALGGDLGTYGINPAGSAVSRYGQFTVTPGLTVSGVNTEYRVGGASSFNKDSHARFVMPNIGLSMIMDTGEDWGLKSVTFAFTANTTNSFLSYSRGRGSNRVNSMLGNLAAEAGYYPAADLSSSDKSPWDLYAAYQAGQIMPYGSAGAFVGSNQLIGGADAYCYLPGELMQTSDHDEYGHKTDLLINMGFNISDRLFLGFNLGMPMLSYYRQDVFNEVSVNPDMFPISFHNDKTGLDEVTSFQSATNVFKLATDASGIYAKFGVIYVPVDGLRIGAAIQTPTAMTISEQWINTADVRYSNSKFDGDGRSPQGEYQYNLRTPYLFNAGVAYAFGGNGLISLDYEVSDYSVMKYSEVNADMFSDDNFRDVNEINNLFCGASHSLRAGVEFKFFNAFAVRGGYAMTTDPELEWSDSKGQTVTADNYSKSMKLTVSKHRNAPMQSLSAGLGYSSPGPFFADIAARMTQYPSVRYLPYYYIDYPAVDKNNNAVAASESPVETIKRNLWDVMVTIGWRF